MRELRECKKHGITEFSLRGGHYWRCLKCEQEAVSKRRATLKAMAVEYKGGKCEICGYNKCISALEFHHLNPEEKDFGISTDGNTRSWKRIRPELDKCILVCSNCHREIHYNNIN